MLPEQRRQRILEAIEGQGIGVIRDLSAKFDVSDMTIRRDLSILEEEGHIRRTRGGAIPAQMIRVEPQYASKQLINRQRKESIAHYAAQNFVGDGDIIILEGGTTAVMMVPHLRHVRGLTVITNGLYTAMALQKLLPDLTVICTGGILREVSLTFVGPIVQNFFSEFHANKVFLSTTGLQLDSGFTDPSLLETEAKKAMIKAADQTILLLDSSKIGVKSLVKVLNATGPDFLITDDSAPESILSKLAEAIEVHVVPASN